MATQAQIQNDPRITIHESRIMQNKPNLLNVQMNVSYAYTEDYENKCLREHPKNKANSNPIQSQSKPIRSQSKPKQTQSKPISIPKTPLIVYNCRGM